MIFMDTSYYECVIQIDQVNCVLEGIDVAIRLQEKGNVIVYQLRRNMLADMYADGIPKLRITVAVVL